MGTAPFHRPATLALCGSLQERKQTPARHFASFARRMNSPTRRTLATETGRLGRTFRFDRIASQTALTDPFLSVEHFRISGSTFPAHPHAGFSTVTYLFDNAETALLHRDSTGARATIEPGDAYWTAAGSGYVHAEDPKVEGVTARGLQVWINLPEELQDRPPYSRHQRAGERPVVETGGVTRRIVIGAHEGQTAPIELPSPAALVDVAMESGSQYTPSIELTSTRFIYVVTGAVRVGEKEYRAGSACLLGSELHATGTLIATSASRVALMHGVPLRQPVHFVGPVAMTTAEKAQRVMSRHSQGLLGRVE